MCVAIGVADTRRTLISCTFGTRHRHHDIASIQAYAFQTRTFALHFPRTVARALQFRIVDAMRPTLTAAIRLQTGIFVITISGFAFALRDPLVIRAARITARPDIALDIIFITEQALAIPAYPRRGALLHLVPVIVDALGDAILPAFRLSLMTDEALNAVAVTLLSAINAPLPMDLAILMHAVVLPGIRARHPALLIQIPAFIFRTFRRILAGTGCTVLHFFPYILAIAPIDRAVHACARVKLAFGAIRFFRRAIPTHDLAFFLGREIIAVTFQKHIILGIVFLAFAFADLAFGFRALRLALRAIAEPAFGMFLPDACL